MELTGIRGKVVLITGASGSIGSGTAEEFARHGASLVLTGREETRLAQTAHRCREICPHGEQMEIFIITADITLEEHVKTLVDKAVSKFGRLDYLVNCAGVIRAGGFLTSKMADYDSIYNTNLKGTFLVCKHAAPHVIDSKGSIVTVSSYVGIRPAYAYFMYSMIAAALDQFTRALAIELGPKGVRVNSVNPGVVQNTNLWTRQDAPLEGKEDMVEQLQADLTKMYPLRRLCKVPDVASAICFLCSDSASFVSGVVLPLDGGKVLTSKSAVDDKPQA